MNDKDHFGTDKYRELGGKYKIRGGKAGEKKSIKRTASRADRRAGKKEIEEIKRKIRETKLTKESFKKMVEEEIKAYLVKEMKKLKETE